MAEGTVIIGCGIIGCATALYLTESGTTDPSSIHLVEAAPEMFASASGKAAGFLASGWFGPATASLGALSFRLHRDLAEQYHGDQRWGYSRSTGTSLATANDASGGRGDDWLRTGQSRAKVAAVHNLKGPRDGPAWLTVRDGEVLDTISSDNTVAQVDPLRLSKFILRLAMHRGVKTHCPAEVSAIELNESSSIVGVKLLNTRTGESDVSIPCTKILIAAGAWSGTVFEKLFPDATVSLPISQLAGHSIVIQSPRWAKQHETSGCHAVFSTLGSGFSPEIFSRIGEEIYVAGLNDPDLPLPRLATDATIDPESITRLKEVAQRLLQDETDVSQLQTLREGLCFRPVTSNGNPILSRIDDDKLGKHITTHAGGGVFVAAGHGPWGISHSLGTGKVMSEMLEGRALSADVSRLSLR